MKTMTNYPSICVSLRMYGVRKSWVTELLQFHVPFLYSKSHLAYMVKCSSPSKYPSAQNVTVFILIFADVTFFVSLLFSYSRFHGPVACHINTMPGVYFETHSVTAFNVNANDPFGNREEFNFITLYHVKKYYLCICLLCFSTVDVVLSSFCGI